ncbi:MAG: hypothetical protein IKA13_05635 [Bacteroidales bacterium]|nr:hypothetical protein [Bacteroidales bacterium]
MNRISNDNPCRKIGLFLCEDLKYPLKNILLCPKQQSLQKNPVIFLQGLLLSELPELPELSELPEFSELPELSELSVAISQFAISQRVM